MCNDPKEYNNGIETFKAETWKEFCQLINEQFVLKQDAEKDNDGKHYINDYVWRGHRCENWDLISYFDREFQRYYEKDYGKDDKLKKNLRQFILKRHLNSFVYASRDKLKQFGLSVPQLKEWINNKTINENHIWALGQHYGVATPMLDWSYSPFTAAYLAFEKENCLEDVDWKSNSEQVKNLQTMCASSEQNNCDITKKIKDTYSFLNRTVWGFNFKKVCRNCKNVFECPSYPNKCNPNTCREKCLLYFDPMSSEHPRLINQRGLFTISNTGESIGEIVKEYWDENKDEEPWLVKITINNNQREEFLRHLDATNINHMTLFPDIYGAAKFSNIGIQFDNYARFHGQGPEVEDDPRKSQEQTSA